MPITTAEQQQLAKFCQVNQLQFQHLELLKEALTHKSYANEVKPQVLPNNERLEFLGDAVLELAITEYLFQHYPTRPEGELTSFRAALVRKESLAEEAEGINLGEYLYMSKGEEATGGRKRAYILANALEALLGAIYLEFGYDTAKVFCVGLLTPKLEQIVANRLDIDAKSRLQEIAQEKVRITPTYTVLEENGPDHNKQFKMGIHLGENLFATGNGHSKQEAEQAAAAEALKNWDELYSKYFNSGRIHKADK
jgi:ribonuclease-3